MRVKQYSAGFPGPNVQYTARSAMNPILKKIGRAIRDRREALGLTRQRLAQVSGVSIRFLNDVELGLANPSVLKLQALAEALGTSVEAFLAESAEGPGTAADFPARAAREPEKQPSDAASRLE